MKLLSSTYNYHNIGYNLCYRAYNLCYNPCYNCRNFQDTPKYKKMQKTHGFGENEQMAGLPVDLQVYTCIYQ